MGRSRIGRLGPDRSWKSAQTGLYGMAGLHQRAEKQQLCKLIGFLRVARSGLAIVPGVRVQHSHAIEATVSIGGVLWNERMLYFRIAIKTTEVQTPPRSSVTRVCAFRYGPIGGCS